MCYVKLNFFYNGTLITVYGAMLAYIDNVDLLITPRAGLSKLWLEPKLGAATSMKTADV